MRVWRFINLQKIQYCIAVQRESIRKDNPKSRLATKEGNCLDGLSAEEFAFYDAISKPQNICDFYTNEQLIEMTHELTEMLRKNRTIDWQLKDQARARMRVMIKRLLKKYKYPGV